MKPIQYDSWTLTDSNGKPVCMGDSVPDFRGNYSRIKGGIPPHKPSSTGRVWTDGGEFFPSVFDLQWTQGAQK